MTDDYLDDMPLNGYEEGEQVTVTKLKELAGELERTLRDRQAAYQRAFAGRGTPGDVALVMADIASFCRAAATTFRADPREHALLEGRREVWLRIRDHLDLRLDELIAKYTGD
jgi:hypothetical protein